MCVKSSQMGLFCYLYLYCYQSANCVGKKIVVTNLSSFSARHTCYCLLFISCCIKVCCKGLLHRAPALIGSKPHIWLSIHDFLITFPLKSLVFKSSLSVHNVLCRRFLQLSIKSIFMGNKTIFRLVFL